jgi:hypothetical protein
MHDFGSQAVTALIVVKIIEWMKKTNWYSNFATVMPIDNKWVHRAVSILGALISAVGIHIAFNGDAATGWHFAGTIPPVHTMLEALWDLTQQFVLNEGVFDMVYKTPVPTTIVHTVPMPSSLPSSVNQSGGSS